MHPGRVLVLQEVGIHLVAQLLLPKGPGWGRGGGGGGGRRGMSGVWGHLFGAQPRQRQQPSPVALGATLLSSGSSTQIHPPLPLTAVPLPTHTLVC